MIRLPGRRRDYDRRVEDRLARANDAIEADCEAMLAEHSAKGLLRSGKTLIRAEQIWSARTRQAIEAALAEFGMIIPTRGREWRRAMQETLDLLDCHHNGAAQLLGPTMRTANPLGPEEGAATKAIMARLNASAEAIAADVRAFRDGWTAPIAKSWHERHPILYAVALLIAGALLSEGVKPVIGLIQNAIAGRGHPASSTSAK